jgi:Uncharacterised nucleotidyltransferase
MTVMLSASLTDFGPEWSLLETLCHGDIEGDRRDVVRGLLDTAGFDFEVLIDHATRHQMLPLLGYVMTEDGGVGPLPPPLRSRLREPLEANRRQLDTLTSGAVEAVQRLVANGVTVVATKGVVLEPTVYCGRGTREMSDADLMIHPESRSAVAETMASLGYRNGVYDPASHAIEDLPLDVRRLYRLSPSHLPHFFRLTNRPGYVQAIDVANSITWARSRWQVPMTEVLARTATVDVLNGRATLPALLPTWQFLFAALHLFRESWFWRESKGTRDALYQYADLLRMWHRYHDVLVAQLPDMIANYDLTQPIGWVLEHTDRTFRTTTMEELGLSGAVSETWLSSANGPSGRDLVWTGTMRARLHLDDTATLLRPAS